VHFGSSAVHPGSPGTINIPNHGFTEKQLLTFGKEYAGSYPTSTSCKFGNGLVNGSKYYSHIIDADTIAIYCGDQSTLMAFSDQGAAPRGFLLVPHFKTSGHCPTTSGEAACSYWDRKLNWIVIRSSAPDSDVPPEHSRLSPLWCQFGNCATLVNPVDNAGLNAGGYTFVTHGDIDGNANPMTGKIHWGPNIEFAMANDPNHRTYANLINSEPWNSDLVLDRVYLHGGGTPQRWGGANLPAFQWNGLNLAFKDSYIDNLTNWGTEPHEGSSGILPAGPGPTVIVNNYFEGVGNLLHFSDEGGSAYLRGDNTVIRNTFKLLTSHMYGAPASDGYMYGNRQPLEFKAGYRNMIAGNVFDTSWNEVTGASVFIALTSVMGEGITDTEVTNNTFMHGPGIANIPLTISNNPQSLPPNRFRFYNNLATDIGTKWWVPSGGAASPTGWLFEGPQGAEDVIVDHNTITGTSGRIPALFFLFDTAVEGVQVTNNIFQVHPSQGMSVDGSMQHPCSGLTDVDVWTCAMSTNSKWSGNLLVPASGSDISQIQAAFKGLESYYSESYSNMTTLVATGQITGRVAYLQSQICEFCGSATTNGNAVGVNLNELLSAQGYVSLVGAVVKGTEVTINFVAPDSQGCPVDYSSTDPNVIAGATRVTDAGGSRARIVNLTGLQHSTNYYFRINCATQQPMGTFKIN